MNLDDEVCYCFHVSRRKLVNFAKREQPVVPSQMSACGGAGTGCGWCIAFLKLIFRQQQDPSAVDGMDDLSSTDYAQKRANYIRSGQGTPAAGATPLPPDNPDASAD